MIEIKQNTDFTLMPNVEINTKQLFGVDCPFKVSGFDKLNDYVPLIDKNYKFDPETTKAILAGFSGNKRVLICGYHGTG